MSIILLLLLLAFGAAGGWLFQNGMRTGAVQIGKMRLSRAVNREGYWLAMVFAGIAFINGFAGALAILWDLATG
ncbi:MAG: hypothetical protein WDM79_18630 [Terricaulis sp.]